MTLATLCLFTGVSAAVFFRRSRYWLKIHKSLNAFSVSGMSAGIIMAVVYVSGTGGKHIDGLHQFIGSAAFVFMVATLFLGFYQFKAKNKLTLRSIHRLLGRFSLVLLLMAIMLGLKLIHII